MAIGWVYLGAGFGAGFFLFVILLSVTPVAFKFDIWLEWLPVPLIIIVDGFLGILIYLNGIVWTIAFAVAGIHIVWILFGASFVSQSIKKTWYELRKDKSFENDQPGLLDTDRTGVQPLLVDLDRDPDDIGVVIMSDNRELYDKLDDDNKEIRLLKVVHVDPSNDAQGGILHFQLIHQALFDDANSYVALSYCVGGGEPNEKIKITSKAGNHVEIIIRPNLYNALRRVIDHKCELLWASLLERVDALCIDQANKDERDKQILRMRSIFTIATRVLAWVPGTQEALWQQDRSTNGTISITASANQGQNTHNENEIEDILDNPYWSRMWIVQEFALAREVEILTQSEVVNEDKLQALLQNAVTRNDKRNSGRASKIMEIRSRCKKKADPTLIDLLLRTSANISERTHDRVFGILSLAKDDQSFLPEPSYRVSEEDLSMRMTRFYLRFSKDSHLDIILLGPYFAARNDLPSWCPHYFEFDQLPDDHRLFDYVQDVFDQAYSSHRQLFQATKGSVCDVKFKGENHRVLCCPASPLGKISSLGWVSSDRSRGDCLSDKPSVTFDASADEVAMGLWDLFWTVLRQDYRHHPPHQYGLSATDQDKNEDYGRCTYPYIYFMLLVFGGGGMDVEEAAPGAQWLSTNQRFIFGQRTLREHAMSMGLLFTHGPFWRWTESVMEMMKASATHKELDWERIHKPLKTIAEQHMRLMTLVTRDKCFIGLAHPNARQEDEVFLLSGCSVPVILRKIHESHQYSVVGDAIVPGAMFGDKWKGHDREVEIV